MAILTNPGFGTEPHRDIGYALICFYTSDPERLGAFYVDVLGFRAKRDKPWQEDASHSTWIDAGPGTLLIHRNERYMDEPFDHAKASILVWFRCDDHHEDVVQQCRDAGIEVYDHHGELVVIRDIEGRRIGLTCIGKERKGP